VERGERIYDSGIAEEAYRPDPGSRVALAEAATLVGGRVVEESAVDAVGPAVRGSSEVASCETVGTKEADSR
jgi:hypothetical protein